MNPFEQAARNAATTQELATASAAVVQRRLEIVQAALADPLRADHVELGRMGAEKVEALAASAGAACVGALDLADRSARAALRESAEAEAHLARLARTGGGLDTVVEQTNWALGVWSRALATSWTLGGALLKSQAETLAPIHAAATANARRLRR